MPSSMVVCLRGVVCLRHTGHSSVVLDINDLLRHEVPFKSRHKYRPALGLGKGISPCKQTVFIGLVEYEANNLVALRLVQCQNFLRTVFLGLRRANELVSAPLAIMLYTNRRTADCLINDVLCLFTAEATT